MIQNAPAVENDIESQRYDLDAEGPPGLFSIDAERSILGAALIDPGALAKIELELDDFHDLRHKLIWRAINTVFKESGSLDFPTVCEQLRKDQKLEDAGGVGYLTELTLSASFNIVGNEKTIREFSRRREAVDIFQNGARSAITLTDDLDLDWAIARLSKLKAGSNGRSADYSTWSDLGDVIGPISWDWPGWLAKGFLNLFVSMTGEGKSSLSLRLCGTYLLSWPWPDGSSFTGQTGFVVWCEAEAGQAINLERAKKWGLPIDKILNPLEDPLSDFRLNNQAHKDQLAFMAMRPDVGFIVVDSLSGADPQAEKSTEDTCNVNWLAALARDTQKPVQLTHHLRKRNLFDTEGVVTLDRVRGISTILQYSRLIWALDTPDLIHKPNKRLAVIKSNLSKIPEPIGVMIDDHGVTFGDAPQAPHVETIADKAADLLLSLLHDQPMQASELEAEIEQAGISWISAKRAKTKLGIVSIKKADGKWYWSLPAQEEYHESYTDN